ncbi:hypothetical protein J7E87_25455 [Streptomyces sp. ISL-1]|uniref:hypothetical protein n=1 Tax=Streptomyces sp. ISL-1 TaxID=2817657 RepID=UPI001BE6CD90|nr:hypothetical protein [Streptomyces sp. ISL-1]MBT2392687.1 hypothetical protein [Streptomyces sp. ISL-1]
MNKQFSPTLLEAARVEAAPTFGPMNVFSGTKRGVEIDDVFPLQPALLNSFFFDFGQSTRGRGYDHHLKRIAILPHSPRIGTMEVAFHDDEPDEYYCNVRHHTIRGDNIEERSWTNDIFCRNECTINLDAPEGEGVLQDFVFVLRGLDFHFRGGDEHLNKIGMLENNGKLTMTIADRHPDSFDWGVKWAWVPKTLFTALGESRGTGRGGIRGGASDSIPSGPAVIRGFRFNFKGVRLPIFGTIPDHHIRDIGVFLQDDGRLSTYFEDRSQNDEFEWIVRWGILAT